jgi:chromosomal replication initiator protein
MTQTMSTLLYEIQRYCMRQDPKKLNVSKDTIIDVVCKAHGFELYQLQDGSRRRPLVKARQIICYLLRKYTNMSLHDIGDIFYQDHTIVVHSCQKLEAHYKLYEEVRMEIRILEARINKTDYEK